MANIEYPMCKETDCKEYGERPDCYLHSHILCELFPNPPVDLARLKPSRLEKRWNQL